MASVSMKFRGVGLSPETLTKTVVIDSMVQKLLTTVETDESEGTKTETITGAWQSFFLILTGFSFAEQKWFMNFLKTENKYLVQMSDDTEVEAWKVVNAMSRHQFKSGNMSCQFDVAEISDYVQDPGTGDFVQVI